MQQSEDVRRQPRRNTAAIGCLVLAGAYLLLAVTSGVPLRLRGMYERGLPAAYVVLYASRSCLPGEALAAGLALLVLLRKGKRGARDAPGQATARRCVPPPAAASTGRLGQRGHAGEALLLPLALALAEPPGVRRDGRARRR
jgi:hypothetical protein